MEWGVRGVTLSAAKGAEPPPCLPHPPQGDSPLRPLCPLCPLRPALGRARPIPPQALRPPARHAALRPPALGCCAGGREGLAALRPEPAAALHPGQLQQDHRGGGGVRAAATRLDGAHQPVRRRPGGKRHPAGRPGALRPGRPHVRKRCFATDTLREGACETDSYTRLRELAADSALAGSTRFTATWSVTAATRAAAGAPRLECVRPQLVVRGAGLRPRLQRQQRGLLLGPGDRPRGRRR